MSAVLYNQSPNAVAMSDGVPLAVGGQRTCLIGALERSAINRGKLRILSGGVEVGASPYVIEADAQGVYTLSGGVVSLVEVSIDQGASWHTFASSTGQSIPVRKGDQVRLTYSVAPSVTFTNRES